MKADKEKMGRLLKTARGQLDGVLRMMEEDKYCIDIANQILAADAVLKKATREILKAHLEGCITEAMISGSEEEQQKKIEELMLVMEKMAR